MAVNSRQKRKMFISVLPEESVEVVISKDGIVSEYYIEMLQDDKTRGNIYKGKIHNIDSSLQAAFISYGPGKNGFLQIDEVHPEYYQKASRVSRGAKYPRMQDVLKPGQEVLVQVVKEVSPRKGAFLTTYLTIPSRFFVLTPGHDQTGVSRKIEDEPERKRLKKIIDEFKLDEGVGLIARTASAKQNKTSLAQDFNFLQRLWKDIRAKGIQALAPALIYEEKDLALRAIRDYLSQDIIECWVDHAEVATSVSDFVALISPRRKKLVKIYDEVDKSMFAKFGFDTQLTQIFAREIKLPSGGQLVIDHSEALIAIDINSGKIGGEVNFHEMAYKTNLEAAKEIPRQLRLRDIGGQVVIDFIEMRDQSHIREVEKTFRGELKNDKARTDTNSISKFGLLEMVRQRLGVSAVSRSYESCTCCRGAGVRRTFEWQSVQALKDIYRLLITNKNLSGQSLDFPLEAELGQYLLNKKRAKLLLWEEKFGVSIAIILR